MTESFFLTTVAKVGRH